MSATIGNMQEIGDFLNAYVYIREFRPVQLTETIKINDAIFVINKDIDGSLNFKPDRKLNFNVCFKYLLQIFNICLFNLLLFNFGF